MKKIILLLFITLNLSCSKETNEFVDKLPYLQFSNEDLSKLLNSENVGKQLIFKNQNNEILKFDIIKNSKTKELKSKGNWVYASYSENFFYFDQQSIELQPTVYIPNYYPIIIEIKKWPTFFSDGSNGTTVSVSNSSKLIANINIDPFNASPFRINFDYSTSVQSLTINGINYDKVVKITVTNSSFINPGWLLPKIDILYFDHNKGIIGFDDINNKQWRLQN